MAQNLPLSQTINCIRSIAAVCVNPNEEPTELTSREWSQVEWLARVSGNPAIERQDEEEDEEETQ